MARSQQLPFDTARPDKPKKRSAAATTLFQIKWNRVILDEAHVIRNPSSGTAVGACLLKAEHRWAVTGTPIQNKVKDFFSLIKFLRLAPFDDYRVWREAVDKRGTVGMQRLNTMVSSLVLRRTKQELGPEMLMLTQRLAHTHYIELSEKEDEVYKALFKDAQMIFRQFLRDQGEHHRPSAAVEDSTSVSTLPADVQGVVSRILRQYTSGDSLTSRLSGRAVLVLLLRLRQCCNHLHLLTSALQGSECDERQLDLELAMGAMSLEDEHTDSARISAIPTRFLRDRPSTKVLEVLKRLKEIEKIDDSSPQKSLIISQWTTMLDIMQHQLTVAGISYLRIDGKVPPKQRSSLVNQFNSHARVPMVMLLSLQAGGVGLNLTGANHVFMLDMHWNPAVEEQAADRCHRVGQMRDVFIHRFVCKGTVEQRILDIQEAKLKLSRDVLSGATRRARDNNKLSLNDLKHLFEINQ